MRSLQNLPLRPSKLNFGEEQLQCLAIVESDLSFHHSFKCWVTNCMHAILCFLWIPHSWCSLALCACNKCRIQSQQSKSNSNMTDIPPPPFGKQLQERSVGHCSLNTNWADVLDSQLTRLDSSESLLKNGHDSYIEANDLFDNTAFCGYSIYRSFSPLRISTSHLVSHRPDQNYHIPSFHSFYFLLVTTSHHLKATLQSIWTFNPYYIILYSSSSTIQLEKYIFPSGTASVMAKYQRESQQNKHFSPHAGAFGLFPTATIDLAALRHCWLVDWSGALPGSLMPSPPGTFVTGGTSSAFTLPSGPATLPSGYLSEASHFSCSLLPLQIFLVSPRPALPSLHPLFPPPRCCLLGTATLYLGRNLLLPFSLHDSKLL